MIIIQIIRFISASLLALILSMQVSAGLIGTVSFSPDGKMFLTESVDRVALWETQTGRLLETFGSSKDTDVRFEFALFLPDGKNILLYNKKNKLIWWNIASGQVYNTQAMKVSGEYAASMDRKKIALISYSSSKPDAEYFDRAFVNVYDTVTGKSVKKIRIPYDGNYCLAFFPDGGQMLISNSSDIKILSTKTGRIVRTIPKSISSFSCKVSPDKNSILFSISPYTNSPDNIWLKGLGRSTPQYPEKKYMAMVSETYEVGYSPNDPNIAYVAGDGNVPSANGRGRGGIVLVWDLRTGKVLQKYAHGYTLMSAAISPDGKSILVQDASGNLILIDIETGTVIRKYSTDPPKEKTTETAYYPLSVYNKHVLAP